MVNIK